MDARQRRAVEAARRQLAIDAELVEAARVKVAAGKSATAIEVQRALEALHAAGELNGPLDQVAEALVDLVTGRLMAALDLTDKDPRVVTGSMLVASDDPYAIGSVLFDPTGALLVDGVYIATVDDAGAQVIAISLEGRINQTLDRHQLLLLGDVDIAAAFIVELYALSARGGFTAALDAAVDQRTAALPAPPTTSEGPVA